MYKLIWRLLMPVVLISPVALSSAESKKDKEYSQSVAVHEHCFTLGQAMADFAAHMTVNYVKIAGADKAKQERLGYIWGQEIVRAVETEIDNALSKVGADLTSEQIKVLKARTTEDKKTLQLMADSIKHTHAQITLISDEEKKSCEAAYAFGTTLAQVY